MGASTSLKNKVKIWREVVPNIQDDRLAKRVRNIIDDDSAMNPLGTEDRELTIDLETEEAMVIVKKAIKATK